MTRPRIDAAYQEELDHVRALRLTGWKLEGLTPYDQLTAAAPDEVALAEKALKRDGYPDDPDYFAHEILVRLLEHGVPESFGPEPTSG
jgi:hypothetical protein